MRRLGDPARPVGTCLHFLPGWSLFLLNNPGTDFVLNCSSSWSIGSDVTVTASYPYAISLLGWVVASGNLNTTMKERVE